MYPESVEPEKKHPSVEQQEQSTELFLEQEGQLLLWVANNLRLTIEQSSLEPNDTLSLDDLSFTLHLFSPLLQVREASDLQRDESITWSSLSSVIALFELPVNWSDDSRLREFFKFERIKWMNLNRLCLFLPDLLMARTLFRGQCWLVALITIGKALEQEILPGRVTLVTQEEEESSSFEVTGVVVTPMMTERRVDQTLEESVERDLVHAWTTIIAQVVLQAHEHKVNKCHANMALLSHSSMIRWCTGIQW